MKFFMRYLIAFSCLWSGGSLATVETQWDGDFTIKEFGEQLNDGSQVYLRYNLNIDSKKNYASLSMITWHAILICTGDYSLKIKPDILELYHSDSENSDCPYPSPQFEITRKGKNYYIKGSVFSYSPSGKWLPLQKVIQK